MAATTPARPAMVSGPGQLSRRTDGGPNQKLRELPDAQYGEAKTFRDLQKGAPLAQTPQSGQASPTNNGRPTAVKPNLTPLSAPSTNPDEPVTTGAALGPGAGPEALGINQPGADYSNARNVLTSVIAASGSTEAQALLNSLASQF